MNDYPLALDALRARHDELVRTLAVLHGMRDTFSVYGMGASHITDRLEKLVATYDEQLSELDSRIQDMADARERCLSAIKRLPADQQTYLVRVHLLGQSQYEAARALGISRATFANKYHRALQLLEDFHENL
ncbi:MAG: hypothetical protein LBP28_05675 [Coriobacteriales bacterium]|nr:hypothetical protein [Coriobacteriales bacterium]